MPKYRKSDKFEPGDVVFLRSGSQPMTVLAVTTDGRVQVGWQDFTGEFQTDEFSEFALTADPSED